VLVTTVGAVLILGGLATGAAAKTVSPEQWAPKFCATLSGWEDTLSHDGDAAEGALSGNTTSGPSPAAT
jgi:hypothetical protein